MVHPLAERFFFRIQITDSSNGAYQKNHVIAQVAKRHRSAKRNAHLIAEAPEMYALLERLGQLGEAAKTFPMLALEKKLFDIIEEARRILAKARGEEKR